MPTVESNGLSLHYLVQGEGEPLLGITGLGADTTAWALQLAAFSAELRVVVYDNRDVGRSDSASEAYTVREMADDALAVADAAGIERFHLVGVSLGGAIAQELALAQPERVATLTLCMSWGGWGRWGAERSRFWAREARRLSREEHVELLMLQTLSEDFFADERRVAAARSMFLSNPYTQPVDAFARQLEASAVHEARDRLGELSMPAHVVAGDRDVLVPVWKSVELARLIPGARLTVLDGAAHAANFERAEQFNAAILGFVREHAGATASA